MKAESLILRPTSFPANERIIAVPENRLARRAIRQVARNTGHPRKQTRLVALLFLHGRPGTGKSHLVRQLMDEVVATRADVTARLIPARDLAKLLTEPPPGERPADEFRACDLLIVEDIQHLPVVAAEAVAALIDYRRARRRQTVVTAISGPGRLSWLPRRLTSRLGCGLVVGIEPFSAASRRRLARILCKRRGLFVADDVIAWLARTPSGGARPIVGDLVRLQEISRSSPLPLTKTALGALESADDAGAPIERIAERIAEHFGLKRNQLQRRARARRLLWPRQVGMYLARRLTGLSLPRIGAYFGGFDHTTVLNACRRVEERLEAELMLPLELAELAAVCD